MAIIADHTMLKFHGRERVIHYILALMNIVSIELLSCYVLIKIYFQNTKKSRRTKLSAS